MTLKYKLEERNGKIAVVGEWHTDWVKPQQDRTIWLFDSAENYGDLKNYREGLHIGSNYVEFYNTISYKYIRFLCDDTATVVHEVVSIKAPGRGGKDWKWVWKEGKWRKQW